MANLKRIRFVRQETVNTRSDHEALLVWVEIRTGRRGPWRPLVLVSVNMGGRFGPDDLDMLFAAVHGTPAVFGLQEGGDQPWVEVVARKNGYTTIAGTGRVGQRSTTMLASPKISVRLVRWQELLGRIFVGSGAGPDFNKPKWWTRTTMSTAGAPFGATSWHLLASQQKTLRLRLAKLQAGPVVRALGSIRRPYFVIGDVNSDHDQPLSRWLRRRGLVSNHEALREIATHGNRSIDGVFTQRRLTQLR